MMGALILGMLLAQAAPAAAPAPQATPLKVIIDVKSRSICTVLHDNVRISLVGLMKNDQIIDLGSKAFAKMADDQIKHSGAMQTDSLVVENAVGAIVHNLSQIDRALNDPDRFPADPKTDDQRAADRVKAQLQAIEDQQRRELNVMNGTIETDALNSMQHDLPLFSPVATAGGGPAAVGTPPPTGIADAGLTSAPDQPKLTDPRQLAAGSLIGTTVYGGAAASMAGAQQNTGLSLEDAAAAAIRELALQCSGVAPRP